MSSPKNLRRLLPSMSRILRQFQPYLRKHRSLMAGSFFAMLFGTLLRLLEPWPLKFVFDHVIIAKSDRPAGVGLLDSLDTLTLLTITSIAVVVITGLRALADYGYRVGFAKLGSRVLTEVRADLYRHLQNLSMSFHTKARSGDLVIRVISDVNMMRDAVVTAVLPLLANVLILAGMWSVMFWLQWQLALLALATIPALCLRMTWLTRRIREKAYKQRRQQGAMAATAAESMGAIRILKALSLEGAFAEAFSRRNSQNQVDDVKISKLSAGLARIVDVLLAIATAMVLWYGARLVLNQTLSPGDLLVFLAYLKKAFNPIEDFAKYTARLAKASAAGDRLLELLAITPEVCDLPDARPAPALRGDVCFHQLSFAYEPGHTVLQDIDFEVRAGQCAALVGASGIGKSTLLNLLLRLYDPTAGRVLIDGHDLREFTLKSLRTQMSVVLQDNILFAASVWDNIGYGASNATRESIEAAARLANAHQFIQALPQGYDTVLGERGMTLSHGQRQRIAIARAAVRKAPLLILDEPTTGLDKENERAVVDALKQLAVGRTTFLISHDLRLASSADRIVYLEGGRVLECGTHEELICAGGRYADLFQLHNEKCTGVPAEEASAISIGDLPLSASERSL